jgi:hypothetical protein
MATIKRAKDTLSDKFYYILKDGKVDNVLSIILLLLLIVLFILLL